MCRLLGVVSSEHTDFKFSLHEAPRSLAQLSSEHPDGWGIAVHSEGAPGPLEKRAVCAKHDEVFGSTSASVRGDVLVAHIRKRTVGPIGHHNTHPFRRGRWTFAHNGTIDDLAWLRGRTSHARSAEIQGETDSELLFAMLLTLLDEHAVPASAPLDDRNGLAAFEAALVQTLRACRARAHFGAANFLLTDGDVLYAHRFGRTLHVLERRDTEYPPAHAPETGVTFSMARAAPAKRRRAVLVASEQLTDEPWHEVADESLLRIDRRPSPRVTMLDEPSRPRQSVAAG